MPPYIGTSSTPVSYTHLIVRPGADLPALGTLLMAVSAVSYAIFQVLTRKLSGKVAGPVQYAYTAFICLIVTALPAPFFLPDLSLIHI